MVVVDTVDMLVTSEPVAELDGALAQAVSRQEAARVAGDSRVVGRLRAWIDYRLDERRQVGCDPRQHPASARTRANETD